MENYEITWIGILLLVLMIFVHSIWINRKLDKIYHKN